VCLAAGPCRPPQERSQITAMAPNTSISLAVALVCLLGIQSTSAFSWQPCGEGKADISTVSLTPESPEPGVTVQFAIKGTASAHP